MRTVKNEPAPITTTFPFETVSIADAIDSIEVTNVCAGVVQWCWNQGLSGLVEAIDDEVESESHRTRKTIPVSR